MHINRTSLVRSTALIALLTSSLASQAKLELPALFSDHMVLQKNAALPIWGWAAPGQKITVKIQDQEKSATANASGKWQLTLDKMDAPGPHVMHVHGEQKITIQDVLVGEVWLGSGQSNMAWTVSRSRNFDKEKPRAAFPQVRMFTVQRQSASTPTERCKGSWKVCSPETVGNFSATAYFFGRHLHQKLSTPVGLINSSWGGTAIEAWTSMPVQQETKALTPLLADWKKRDESWDPEAADARFKQQLAKWQKKMDQWKLQSAAADGNKPPRKPRRPRKPANPAQNQNHPANLFNGMIQPLIPYAMRGAIWYQGERNARTLETAALYETQLPLLIQDWRKRWNAEFPFAWVQLPNFKKRVEAATQHSAWAVIRDSMRKSLKVPNTGMAITIDVGMAKDIHPKNKQAVGNRLGRWALSKVYGKKAMAMGPLFVRAKTVDATIVCTFRYGRGMKCRRKAKECKGFAIAGEDQVWHPATATIDGRTVVVSSPKVPAPVAVRYAWADNPDCNLVGRSGIPASPFRTDSWSK